MTCHPHYQDHWCLDTGYKRGQADFVWGLIKQAAAVNSNQYQEWRKNLESKGYRKWEGSNGREVFAKLATYSKGDLILIEPGGERYKTKESQLSKKDQKWIAEQKILRGIRWGCQIFLTSLFFSWRYRNMAAPQGSVDLPFDDIKLCRWDDRLWFYVHDQTIVTHPSQPGTPSQCEWAEKPRGKILRPQALLV